MPSNLSRAELPWYAKAAYGGFGLVLVLAFLYLGRDVLIPIVYGGLLAVLVQPVSGFLMRHKIPRFLSILFAVTSACIVVAGVVTIIAMQIGQFADAWPQLKAQAQEFVTRLQALIKDNLGITYKDQLRWFQQWGTQLWQRGGEALGQTFLTFMDLISLVILVPLYAFLILYYKDHLIKFLYALFGQEESSTLHDILEATSSVMKSYVVGLLIEAFIVSILNSAALLLLGVDYAILFGILAAILNLIPYIGILIGSLLPIVMALITKDSLWYPIGVAGSMWFVQLIDNNILVPYIVASRVSINALISVIAVIVGGMLWGISGMFLSLPTVAILKVVCDRVEGLKHWGELLGYEVSSTPGPKAS